MRKSILPLILLVTLLAACNPATHTPVSTMQVIPTIALPTREPTETPQPLEVLDESPAKAIDSRELAAAFTLPSGYLAELLVLPSVANVTAIARSQTGRIYLQRGGPLPGLSLMDAGSGDITDILSTAGLDAGRIFDGPVDSVLIQIGNELWRVNTDGSHEVWSQSVMGEPLFFSPGGEIYGASVDGTQVIRQSPGVSALEVAGGFNSITDLVVAGNGTLFVVDGVTSDLVRVDPDGGQLLLDASVPDGEPVDIGLDAAGNLYRNSSSNGFARVEISSGALEPYDFIYSPCTDHPGDFVITENGMVIFIDAAASQVVWGDLAAGQTGVLVSNEGLDTGVVDVGPDGALYLGVSTCGGAMPSQIIRVGRDGARSTAYDSISGRITALTYDLRGGIYLATSSASAGNRLWYYPAPGAQPYLLDTSTDYEIISLDMDPNTSHVYATLSTSQWIQVFDWQGQVDREYAILPRAPQEYDLAVDGSGQLYAYMSEKGRYLTGPRVDRYLLKLITAEAKAELIETFTFKGHSPTGALVAGMDGTLWLLLMPDGQLWRVLPEGKPELFAQNLPAGSAGLAVNLYGDVFLTTSGGIYRFYRNEGS
jgi:WD40 repeat protein